MRDYTMCLKIHCAARKSCARFTDNPERGQALYCPDPSTNQYGSCEHFMADVDIQLPMNADEHLTDFPAITPDYPSASDKAQYKHDAERNRDNHRMTHNASGGNSTRKYYHMQHRTNSIKRHSAMAPVTIAAQGSVLDKLITGTSKCVERGHDTRMASDHSPAVHSAEAVRGHIHIVVMAEDDMVAVRELSHEMNEVIQAKY